MGLTQSNGLPAMRQFPPELIRAVAECLQGRVADLKAMTLTCRSLRAEAQAVLMRAPVVRIEEPEDLDEAFQFFASRQFLAVQVTNLTVRRREPQPPRRRCIWHPAVDYNAIVDFIEILPNLRHLQVLHIDLRLHISTSVSIPALSTSELGVGRIMRDDTSVGLRVAAPDLTVDFTCQATPGVYEGLVAQSTSVLRCIGVRASTWAWLASTLTANRATLHTLSVELVRHHFGKFIAGSEEHCLTYRYTSSA